MGMDMKQLFYANAYCPQAACLTTFVCLGQSACPIFFLSRTAMNRKYLQKQSQLTTDRDCSVLDVGPLIYGCLTRRGAAGKRDSRSSRGQKRQKAWIASAGDRTP